MKQAPRPRTFTIEDIRPLIEKLETQATHIKDVNYARARARTGSKTTILYMDGKAEGYSDSAAFLRQELGVARRIRVD